jgi:hypothetical membrane protein
MTLKPFTLAAAYWIAIIIVAHFFAPPGYVWTQNTISELASQGHAYKWIMQAGLIGFGALILLAVGRVMIGAKKWIWHLLPVAVYGLSVLLSGFYCAAPISPSIPYLIPQAKLHSLFATLGGALTLGILWRMFVTREMRERWIHFFFFVAVTGVSGLFGLADSGVIDIGIGVVQMLLYLFGFAWLIYQERTEIPKGFAA